MDIDQGCRRGSGGSRLEGVLMGMGLRFFSVLLEVASGLSRYFSQGRDSDVCCPPPQCKDAQQIYWNTELKAKVKAKLEKVMEKGYIEIADIQMVDFNLI